jgi:hypothetical protein
MGSRWDGTSFTLEEQLAQLRQQIEAAEAELVAREAELVDLRVEMSAFQLDYEVKVGRKYEALEATEATIARCKQRIEAHRQWGNGGPPMGWGGEPHVPVEEQYRRTWVDPPPPSRWFDPPPMDAATVTEIKSLYRQLCRRFHPDLAQDPEERAWRTEMMAAVNAAYEAMSVTELQALAARPDRAAAARGETGRQRRDALRDRLRQIRARLREVEGEIRDLTRGSMMELRLEVRLAARRGRDLLAEMGAEVEKDLVRKRAELDFLKAQLRQMGIVCE